MRASMISTRSIHSVFFVFGRLILGGIFVWFALNKLFEPIVYFEGAIAEYQILPQAWIPLFANVLPWGELVVGLFVILGWWFRYSVATVMLMLLMFMIAIASTTVRGLVLLNCGCGGSGFSFATLPHEVFIKDTLLFLIGIYLLKAPARIWMLDQWK